jgi:hypothetical protein
MLKIFQIVIFLIHCFFISYIYGGPDSCKTYSINPDKLTELHKLYIEGKLQSNESFKELIIEADNFLEMEPVSVIYKLQTPPSGDKHDYMSIGPYWWPNPETPDSLPYIRKDGERNPEIYKITDHKYCSKMIEAVGTLSLAYFITKESKYSGKAVQLLRIWFLDEETKMNPNLNYAQGIPSICEGRGIGIIETAFFYIIIDAIGILETSDDWSEEDDSNMKKWFEEYLTWLTTNQYGIDESNWKNNHGSWYDVQVVSISLFLGKNDLAKKILNEAKIKRISAHILQNGKQPFELERTRSWHYSEFNLTALFQLAVLGDNIGINLWDYESDKGGSMRKALDYLLGYILKMDQWEYEQIEDINPESIYPLLLLSEKKYDKKIYSDWIKKIYSDKIKKHRANLLY